MNWSNTKIRYLAAAVFGLCLLLFLGNYLALFLEVNFGSTALGFLAGIAHNTYFTMPLNYRVPLTHILYYAIIVTQFLAFLLFFCLMITANLKDSPRRFRRAAVMGVVGASAIVLYCVYCFGLITFLRFYFHEILFFTAFLYFFFATRKWGDKKMLPAGAAGLFFMFGISRYYLYFSFSSHTKNLVSESISSLLFYSLVTIGFLLEIPVFANLQNRARQRRQRAGESRPQPPQPDRSQE